MQLPFQLLPPSQSVARVRFDGRLEKRKGKWIVWWYGALTKNTSEGTIPLNYVYFRELMPTSQQRRQQGYGFWPFLLRPVLAHRAPLRSPSFCAKDFPSCTGSPTALDQSMTGVYRTLTSLQLTS